MSIGILYILVIALIPLVIIFLVSTLRVLNKLEKAEDMINGYESHIKALGEIVTFVDQRVTEMDNQEIFKTSDEVGFFFERLKMLNDLLKNFKV